MADEDKIVEVELLGRQMQIRIMTPGQAVLMARMAQRTRRQSSDPSDVKAASDAYNSLMTKMLDVVDTLFVSETDRQDVEDAVLARKISLDDLMMVALGGRRPQPLDDDADPVAAPKTLKDKKAAGVTKVAKKTANSRRASR